MPIKKNNQAIGIRKNGSTKVPSGATSEPITLNAAMQPNDKIKGIRVINTHKPIHPTAFTLVNTSKVV